MRLLEEVQEHHGLATVLGDFNFVDDVEDTIKLASGHPCGYFAQLNAGFSRKNLAQGALSAMDRMYCSWFLPILQHLRAELRMRGSESANMSSSSPSLSVACDRWAI